jgi:hypothetical protein
MRTRVEITDEERIIAVKEGRRRQAVNEAAGRVGTNLAPSVGSTALKNHIQGAIGELVVAKYLNMLPELFAIWRQQTKPIPGSSDLPGKIDVKTVMQERHRLLVQIDEPLDHVYFLVACPHEPVVIGWITGQEAHEKGSVKELQPGRPCIVVEHHQLHLPKMYRRITA